MLELTFGERLNDLRNAKMVTQDELAILLEVDRSTISGYENGKSYPSVEKTIKLAHYFAVSIDYLLAQTDHMIRDDVLDQAFTICDDRAVSIGLLVEKAMSLTDSTKQDLIHIIEMLKKDQSGNIGRIITFYESLIDHKHILIK